jgi:hypothetical protein
MPAIDAHAPAYDITDSHVAVIDASPEAVLTSLDRLGFSREVAVLEPARLHSADESERVYALAWPVADGFVRVVWDARVQARGENGTVISTTVRFIATDGTSRQRLRASWALVGPVSAGIAARALAAVKRIAEEDDEPVSEGALLVAAPRRALLRAA